MKSSSSTNVCKIVLMKIREQVIQSLPTTQRVQIKRYKFLTLTEEEEDKESPEDEFHGDVVVSLEDTGDLRSKDRSGQGRVGVWC